MSHKKPSLLSSASLEASLISLVGAKAANLAWLKQNGFLVPNWWVVSTSLFDEFLKKSEVGLLIDSISESNILEISLAIQNALLNTPLPPSLDLSDLPSGLDYAVRSSLCDEDGAKYSFAGQMDSYLYQRSPTELYQSIKRCFASAYSERALRYRLSNGLSLHHIKVAVIIQEMITGEVSGVAFTAHPIRGSRRFGLISANYGLCEGVVSGQCDCDEYHLDFASSDVETVVSKKEQMTVRLPYGSKTGSGSNTTLEFVPSHLANESCLTPAHISALSQIIRDIGDQRGTPQDIEWTLRDGQFFILQTRPITSLRITQSQYGRTTVFDNSNIQESYYGVTTPLTFSFAASSYFHAYNQVMALMGFSVREIEKHARRHRTLLSFVKGRVYYNINHWYEGLLLLPSFGKNKQDLEKMMGVTEPVEFVQDLKLNFLEKLRILPKLGSNLIRLLRLFSKIDALYLNFNTWFETEYQKINRSRLQILDGLELMELAVKTKETILKNWTTPIINDFFVMMNNGKVTQTLKKLELESELMNLLSGQELPSTAPTKALIKMSHEIRLQPELCILLREAKGKDLLTLVKERFPTFHRCCSEFIEAYGDRTAGELKLETLTFREDPELMFVILRKYIDSAPATLASLSADEATTKLRSEDLVFTSIKKRLGFFKLLTFKRDLKNLKKAIVYREGMRLARTRAFGLFRTLFLEIGGRLAEQGLIENSRDVFYLTEEELDAFYQSTAVHTHLKPLIETRKNEFKSFERAEPPHQFVSTSPVYAQTSLKIPTKTPDTGTSSLNSVLKGLGCYPGVVKKVVRIVKDPTAQTDLSGKILCTVRTDPGWAPLFMNIEGLIVERGSTLSHSAIIARELKIPAIVGAPSITELIYDQELIEIDGSQGLIKTFRPLTTSEHTP